MPGKLNKKSKALKDKTQNNFFRALLFGLLSCAAVWVVLAMIFALALSFASDSTPFVNVLSYAVVVISLAVGGAVAGKLDKNNAVLSALVLGFGVLALSYLVSCVFNLSRDMGIGLKTLIIALMIVSPLIGAGLSTRNKPKRAKRRK